MSADDVARGCGLTTDATAAAFAYSEEHKATIDRQIAADNGEFARLGAAGHVSAAGTDAGDRGGIQAPSGAVSG